MENKIKKKSINTVIYLLLAAMFVCVVLISVYTVASKTAKKDPVLESVSTSSSVKIEPTETEPSADTVNAVPETSGAAVPVSNDVDPETLPVASTDGEAIPVSIETRHFILPVSGTPAKSFQIDIPVYSLTMNDYRAHTGLDITAPIGSKVLSASAGTISRIWNDPLMGKSITIDHGDGIYTTYQNLGDEIDPVCAVGAKVSMGQAIATIGESALIEISEEPHLHLEMKINGNYVNPLDYISVSNSEDFEDSVYE